MVSAPPELNKLELKILGALQANRFKTVKELADSIKHSNDIVGVVQTLRKLQRLKLIHWKAAKYIKISSTGYEIISYVQQSNLKVPQ